MCGQVDVAPVVGVVVCVAERDERLQRAVVDQRDGWTALTVDGKLSAQFEHTILMTEKGPEVMTLTRNGPRRGHVFSSPEPLRA